MKNKKILILIIIVAIVVVAIVGIVISNKESKDVKFKAVAHVANIGLADTNNLFISPQLVNAWYFEETKDIVICFSGENTSTNFYAYFLNAEEFGYNDYMFICTSVSPLTKNNLIFKDEKTSQTIKDNAYTLMSEIMQSQNKLESTKIEKINKLIDNGKIKNY